MSDHQSWGRYPGAEQVNGPSLRAFNALYYRKQLLRRVQRVCHYEKVECITNRTCCL